MGKKEKEVTNKITALLVPELKNACDPVLAKNMIFIIGEAQLVGLRPVEVSVSLSIDYEPWD